VGHLEALLTQLVRKSVEVFAHLQTLLLREVVLIAQQGLAQRLGTPVDQKEFALLELKTDREEKVRVRRDSHLRARHTYLIHPLVQHLQL